MLSILLASKPSHEAVQFPSGAVLGDVDQHSQAT